MFKVCFAVLGLVLAATCSNAQSDPPTTGSLLGDAKVIITSNKGDVRLWAHPPRMLVFGDARTRLLIRQIVERLETEISSPFGEMFFGDVQFQNLPKNFGEGQSRIWIRIREGGPSGQQIELKLHENSTEKYETDILVVVSNRTNIALINGLWGMSPRDNRAMLEGGRGRCFYSARSREGFRYGALVSIFPNEEQLNLEECLWEEILHALGPLVDAVGSRFFSFDDQADYEGTQPAKLKRMNDILLIRSLYESGVEPGGSPDKVIDFLGTLTPER